MIQLRNKVQWWLTLLFCLMPCMVLGQSTVWGIVRDSLSGEPLPFATVYVNGSTKGTITDDDGLFELRNVHFPSTIVFSFVGYRTQVLDLDSDPGTLQIKLTASNNLPEVVITDSSEREMYLNYFRTMFLGVDRWGRNATIRNEDIIMFQSFGADGSDTVFKAWAGKPIIIDLPLLGYELDVDLVDFTVKRTGGRTVCDILGYFFYKPYSTASVPKTSKFERNRKSAYYNSSMHFLRSLYQDRLAENGYILSMSDSVTVTRTGDGRMQICGPDDRILKIQYFHKLDGSPLDLTTHSTGLHMYSESGIHLLKDTCTVLSNGTVTDNSIRFTGEISQKRVGATLPVMQ